MDFKEEFSSLGLKPAMEPFAWDARAKITWGDPPDRVRDELVARGIDHRTADHIVELCLRERAV